MLIRVLGPVEVRDGQEWHALSASKWRGLLALLAINVGQVTSIDQMVDELWGDRPPRQPVNQIHGYVMRLRRRLSDPDGHRLQTRAPGYCLTVGPDELDSLRFAGLVTQARQSREDGRLGAAIGALTEAGDLWRGPAYADVSNTLTVETAAAALQEQRLAAEEVRFELELECGRHQQVIEPLRRKVQDQPLRERLWAQLMLALYRDGRRAEALAAYHRLARHLDRELGVPPAAPVRLLQERIVRNDPSLEPVSPPRPAAPSRPPADPVPRQLPAPVRHFTGRERELRNLLATLADPAAAVVVTVDGMAGVGKTALAVHAAHRLADRFPDGQLFLNLRGHSPDGPPVSPTEALDQLLLALGAANHRAPADVGSRSALLRTQLAGRQILLVLDDAAAEAQVRPLLPGLPGCAAIVTGRRRLTGLDAARSLTLSALSTEDAMAMLAASLDLRWPAAEDDLHAIALRCGGLPLALQVVAARLHTRPVWSLAHLAGRLQEKPGRLAELQVGGRGVPAAFDSSYRLLEAPQQRAFRLLNLIPGNDFGLAAAAALLDLPASRTEQLLEGLVDQHLLEQPQLGRYRLHPLVRCYSQNRLAESDSGRRDAECRLINHYVAATGAAVAALLPRPHPFPPGIWPAPAPVAGRGPDRAALAWLDAEHPNLLAAARRARELGLLEPAWQLPCLLSGYFEARWQIPEWISSHRQALSAACALDHRVAAAVLFDQLGGGYAAGGRYAEARDYYRHAVSVWRAGGEPAGEAMTHLRLGRLLARRGQLAEADRLSRYARDLAAEAGDQVGYAVATGQLGQLSAQGGQPAAALSYYQESLAAAESTADQQLLSWAQTNLATGHDRLGQVAAALDQVHQALHRIASSGYRPGRPAALVCLGRIYRHQGRLLEAVEQHRAAVEQLQVFGSPADRCDALHELAESLSAAGRAAEAHRWYESAGAIAARIGDRYRSARAGTGLGSAARDQLACAGWQPTG